MELQAQKFQFFHRTDNYSASSRTQARGEILVPKVNHYMGFKFLITYKPRNLLNRVILLNL